MKKASTVIPTDLNPLPNDDAVGRVRVYADWLAGSDDRAIARSPSPYYGWPKGQKISDLRSLLNRLERAEGGRDGVSK